MTGEPDNQAVHVYLVELQDRLCAALEAADGRARFGDDRWERESGGGGRTRVLRDGGVFEQAGVGYSRIHGSGLPAAATAHRPDLAGRGFEASGVSVILHPHNPYVPTAHLNVRYFAAERAWSISWRPRPRPRYGARNPIPSRPVWARPGNKSRRTSHQPTTRS